jgi:acyl-coenzyme A synthetase/AMP-(fatty) acid ligase
MTTSEPFADTLARRLAGYGDQPFIEFERTWHSGNAIADLRALIDTALMRAGVAAGEPGGVVVRNRLAHAAAVLGFVASGRPVVMIYSFQSARSIAADVERLRLTAVLADVADWTDPVITAVLAHTVFSITHGTTSSPDDPPDVVFWPFGSIGVCQLLAAVYTGKRMVLLEKFTVDDWVRAVQTYRLRRGGVQPAIVRMLLESDVAKEDLASLDYLVGGAGPLERELREEFESRFGIPLLWAYGATEFAGSVCGWTPELRERYGAEKPDSSGRPLPGVDVRIVDAETGREVPVGQQGLLEARVQVMGPDWVLTTDVAAVDDDGFVTLYGRADGAINRGGFKVLPETVRRVLITHPAVRDACVVGVPHRRLGEVPFAAAELRRGATPPKESELKDLVRDALPSHHVPVAIVIAAELPRNAAMKVRPAEVAAWYRPQD